RAGSGGWRGQVERRTGGDDALVVGVGAPVVLLDEDGAVGEHAVHVCHVVTTREPGHPAGSRGAAHGPAVTLPLALPRVGATAAGGQVRPCVLERRVGAAR